MIQVSIFVDGKQISQVTEQAGKELSIGRSPGCLVRLPDPGVSRLHASIKFGPNGWVLEKKSSFGSLTVNGEEVENAILQGGEEIVIATFVLRINIDDEPRKQVTQAAPAPILNNDSEQEDSQAYIASQSSRTNIARSQAFGYLRFEPGAANMAELTIKKDKVLIGRATGCDVVLTEKKASRKHLEIRREGLSFYLKDLGSANGTIVNEKKVDSVELVPGDVIKVGESRFEFSIENKDFFKKQDQFMPVPQAAIPEGGISASALSGDKTRGAISSLSSQPEVAENQEPEKSLFKKRWKQFQKLPRTTRLIIILAASIVVPIAFNAEPEKKQDPKPRITRAADGTVIRRYEDLSDKNKKMVRESYQTVLDARGEKNYQKMLDNAMSILRLVNDYRDTKIYENEARRGLEEEEKRAEEDRVRKFQEELARDVALMVQKGEKVFEAALRDPSRRSELDTVVQEIFTRDPNNSAAQTWLSRIRAKVEEEARQKEQDEIDRRLKDKAEAEFAKLEKLFVEEKYIEALQFADTIPQVGYTKDSFLERIEDKKNEIRAKLSSVIDPLLAIAEQERTSNGDLVKAKENYTKVLNIDPSNERGREGLEAIRSVLHLRAKRLYAQAILAESVTSLDEARQSLVKCLQVAPDKDPYRRRCENKLSKYEAFTKEAE
jgi:pSer/pThr/pTyr-binding forkhead associated (FHA) protein